MVEKGDTVICQDFKRNGKLFREHVYVNGKYDFTRRWHYRKNGEFECLYAKSKGAFAKYNGPIYLFYPDGQLKACSFMEHGKRIGPCRQYYPSGKVQHTCQGHVKGKLNGVETSFYENGQVHLKLRWEHGRLLEIFKCQDEQGNNLITGDFTNGNGNFVYQEAGKPAMIITVKNGKPVKKKRLKQ